MLIVQEQSVVVFLTDNYDEVKALTIVGDYEEDVNWIYNNVEYAYCVKLFLDISEES